MRITESRLRTIVRKLMKEAATGQAMNFKYKVPCEEIMDAPEFSAVIDGKSSGDDIDAEMGVHFGGDENFPENELAARMISFEFQMGAPVGLWCHAKTKDAAKAMCDYLAALTGNVPSEVYDRWIFCKRCQKYGCSCRR